MPIDLYNLLTTDMHLSPKTFSDQVIIVTGAGQGIGYYTARAFAFLGGMVVLAELSEQGKTAEIAIREESGTALYIQTDVSDEESVNHMCTQVHQAFGPVDILINNAIFIRQARVSDLTTEIWDRTIAINLRGTYLTCRTFLPDMLNKNQGVILNLISTDAMPGLSAYIASKAAITGFTQSLALELDGTNVRAIPFGPGMVDTPGIRRVATGLAPQLGLSEDQFLNLSLHADYAGLMPPEHAAAAAVYLAVHLAEEFHGQVVNGYEVLERSGILQTAPEYVTDINNPSSNGPESTQALFEKLTTILDETEAEFNKLPVFARPLAKGGFKNKSGLSLTNWQRLSAGLASGADSYPANIVERLEALGTYFREVPRETARFTKDETTLKMVTETAQSRLEVIQALITSFR